MRILEFCRSHAMVVAASGVIALSLGGGLQSAQAVEYRGTLDFYSSSGRLLDDISGVTSIPTTYVGSAGGASAISTTSSAGGGSVFGSADGGSAVATSYGLLRATLRVVGPVGGPVGFNVTANGYVDGFGVYDGRAAFLLYRPGSGGVLSRDISTYSALGRQSFSINEMVFLETNVDYVLDLFIQANARASSIATHAEAFVDPTFTIDPLFASSYTLTGLPVESMAVPEPATWGMMILGFGALGTVIRRRRSMASAVAA